MVVKAGKTQDKTTEMEELRVQAQGSESDRLSRAMNSRADRWSAPPTQQEYAPTPEEYALAREALANWDRIRGKSRREYPPEVHALLGYVKSRAYWPSA